MDKITVSAPGKLMLLGEHSVVYGHPCLVETIDKRVKVEIEKSEKDQWEDKKFTEAVVTNFKKQFNISQPLKITMDSQLSNYGLGSSSAVTVAVAFGLFKLFFPRCVITSPSTSGRTVWYTPSLGINSVEGSSSTTSGEKDSSTPSRLRSRSVGMTREGGVDKKELFDFCYQVVLEVQGVSSGFDMAAAIYGGIIYFVTAGKIIEPLPIAELPLLVAYSGTKADTVSMVNLVKEKILTHKNGVEEIFKNIEKLVEEAKVALQEKDWERLGVLMNFNQDYLEDLGVSTEKLDDMIFAARKSGAYGAKLSGAGGGDCMIALVSEEKRKEVEEAIKKAGGEILDIKICREGVKFAE